jgi:hypothetical protein
MSYLNFILFVCLAWSQTALAAGDQKFTCAKHAKAEQMVVRSSSCDDTPGYDLITADFQKRPELKKLFANKTEADIEKDPLLKDKALEAHFRLTSNMNAMRFTFSNGVTREVYRGAYLAPQFIEGGVLEKRRGDVDKHVACMKQLVRDHGLSKIVNYDEQDWPSAERMTREEKVLFKNIAPKAAYWEFTPKYGRTFQYKFRKAKGDTLDEQKKDVMDMVAAIIREIQGDPNEPGAVYIHCYGGHHRTGVVYGVMQKCFANMAVEDILDEYKCHIGFESPTKPGGYNADNEIVIREFPCEQYFPKK